MQSPDRHRPLRHLYSSDNMHAQNFNIPNLKVEQRKTSSAEDMVRKNSAGKLENIHQCPCTRINRSTIVRLSFLLIITGIKLDFFSPKRFLFIKRAPERKIANELPDGDVIEK